jgi:hypothetical protein
VIWKNFFIGCQCRTNTDASVNRAAARSGNPPNERKK